MTTEEPAKRQIVLCFDGTGNTFRADGADTNILKIYRMLEKSDNTRECSDGLIIWITPLRSIELLTFNIVSYYQRMTG